MTNALISAYETFGMMIFVTIFAGLIGAVATNINGAGHAGETWQLHAKHMLDGFVMAGIISIPAVLLMTEWGMSEAMIFFGILVTSVTAPALLRVIKLRGVDLIIARLQGGKK